MFLIFCYLTDKNFVTAEACIKIANLVHSCQKAGMIQSDQDDDQVQHQHQHQRNVKINILALASKVLQAHEVPLKLNVNQVSFIPIYSSNQYLFCFIEKST